MFKYLSTYENNLGYYLVEEAALSLAQITKYRALESTTLLVTFASRQLASFYALFSLSTPESYLFEICSHAKSLFAFLKDRNSVWSENADRLRTRLERANPGYL